MTIAERIAHHPKPFEPRPAVITVGGIPVNANITALTSPSDLLRACAQNLVNQIRERGIEIDEVYGLATRGIAIGTAIALEMNIPIMAVRKEPRGGGKSGRMVEGGPAKSARVCIADDTMGTGNAKEHGIRCATEEAQSKPVLIALLMDGMDPKTRGHVYERFEKQGIEILSCLTHEELVEAHIAGGKIPKELGELVWHWIYNRDEWNEDPSHWHKTLRAYQGLGIGATPEVITNLSKMFPDESFDQYAK